MIRIFKFRSEKKVNHIHDTVFMGYEGRTLQNAGTIIFSDTGEWQWFGAMVLLGADKMNETSSRVKIINEGWSPEQEGMNEQSN